MAWEASVDLGVGFGAAGAGGVGDAVAEVVVEEAEGDGFQGGGDGGDLGEDVDAVLSPRRPCGEMPRAWPSMRLSRSR